MGACLAAFQLTDRLLFRPLPIAGADRLHAISHGSTDANGQARWIGAYEYPLFARMRDAARPHAELLAVSPAERLDVTYGADAELEMAAVQYVSGGLFTRFGLRPAAGRLFTQADDRTPGAHPVALITHDYWQRRLGGIRRRSAGPSGSAVRLHASSASSQPGFTGTETGTVTDVFLPTMMNRSVAEVGDSWVRILVHLEPGASAPSLRDRLTPVFVAFRAEKSRGMRGARPESRAALSQRADRHRAGAVWRLGAPAGVSAAAARARPARRPRARHRLPQPGPVAGRAHRGATRRAGPPGGDWRRATAAGADDCRREPRRRGAGDRRRPGLRGRGDPRRAAADWRLRTRWRSTWRRTGASQRSPACSRSLATASFGLAPAWRSAAIRPMQAIRGGADDRRRRLAPVLIAVQSAFCVVIVVLAALFVGTFDRIAHQPMGFTADGVVLVDVFSRSPQPLAGLGRCRARLWPASRAWTGRDGRLSAAQRQSSNGFIAIAGGGPERTLSTFLSVSPGWLDAMRVPLVAGRDFGPADARPGSAIVNQAFADTYFAGVDPIGRTFDRTNGSGRFTIVGVVANVRYRDLRGAIQPTAFLPFRAVGRGGAVRPPSGAGPSSSARAWPIRPPSRRRCAAPSPRASQSLLVSTVRTQHELIEVATRRERLLSMLGTFFATVALLLAAVGLYGVLDDAVVQRRREIGIRLAIGARTAMSCARRRPVRLAMVGLGGLLGWAGAVLLARSLGTLVYQVHPTSPAIAAIPCLRAADGRRPCRAASRLARAAHRSRPRAARVEPPGSGRWRAPLWSTGGDAPPPSAAPRARDPARRSGGLSGRPGDLASASAGAAPVRGAADAQVVILVFARPRLHVLRRPRAGAEGRPRRVPERRPVRLQAQPDPADEPAPARPRGGGRGRPAGQVLGDARPARANPGKLDADAADGYASTLKLDAPAFGAGPDGADPSRRGRRATCSRPRRSARRGALTLFINGRRGNGVPPAGGAQHPGQEPARRRRRLRSGAAVADHARSDRRARSAAPPTRRSPSSSSRTSSAASASASTRRWRRSSSAIPARCGCVFKH